LKGVLALGCFVSMAVADLRKESSWPDTHRWFAEKLTVVYDKILPKLRAEMDSSEAA
jgi:hypothetical protein